MKIAVASDHAGYGLKSEVVGQLQKMGHEVFDLGCHSVESVDYPDFAALVAQQVSQKQVERGILVCGTGIGMAITANKFSDVRAASLTDLFSCEMTRRHNDLNVLCLGARVVGSGLASHLVEMFLSTPFEGGRHTQRVNKIKKWERGE